MKVVQANFVSHHSYDLAVCGPPGSLMSRCAKAGRGSCFFTHPRSLHRLEAAALGAAGAGETQILIDDVDALARPAEIDGTIDEAVLELGALLMVLDLGNGRLAHIDEGALGTMERGRGRVRPDRGGQHDGSPRRGRAGGGATAWRGVEPPAAASRH